MIWVWVNPIIDQVSIFKPPQVQAKPPTLLRAWTWTSLVVVVVPFSITKLQIWVSRIIATIYKHSYNYRKHSRPSMRLLSSLDKPAKVFLTSPPTSVNKSVPPLRSRSTPTIKLATYQIIISWPHESNQSPWLDKVTSTLKLNKGTHFNRKAMSTWVMGHRNNSIGNSITDPNLINTLMRMKNHRQGAVSGNSSVMNTRSYDDHVISE